jgi:hypothetical protein
MFAPEINSVAARGQPIRLWYTGLDINATAGSRAGWACHNHLGLRNKVNGRHPDPLGTQCGHRLHAAQRDPFPTTGFVVVGSGSPIPTPSTPRQPTNSWKRVGRGCGVPTPSTP